MGLKLLSVEKDAEIWHEETNLVRSSCLHRPLRNEREHPEVNSKYEVSEYSEGKKESHLADSSAAFPRNLV